MSSELINRPSTSKMQARTGGKGGILNMCWGAGATSSGKLAESRDIAMRSGISWI